MTRNSQANCKITPNISKFIVGIIRVVYDLRNIHERRDNFQDP